MKISPSILAADIIGLRPVLSSLEGRSIDFIHLDVMDGHFVPQLSYGEAYAAAVRDATDIPLDVHLMVSRPENEVPKYFALKPHNITFHVEATEFAVRLAQSIREQGIKAGIALNPGTPAARISELMDHIDLVLVMSVEPGYYGQKFISSTLNKMEQIRDMIGDRDIVLEADGGINANNVGTLARSGVEQVVAGAAIFREGDPNANARLLKAAADPVQTA